MRGLFIFFLLVMWVPLIADVIEGIYEVNGFDPYLQESYSGRCEIKQKGQIYEAVWKYDEGMQIEKGNGFQEGDVLVLVFQEINGVTGAEYCKIQNGVLEGIWILLHGDKKGRETLTKIK